MRMRAIGVNSFGFRAPSNVRTAAGDVHDARQAAAQCQGLLQQPDASETSVRTSVLRILVSLQLLLHRMEIPSTHPTVTNGQSEGAIERSHDAVASLRFGTR